MRTSFVAYALLVLTACGGGGGVADGTYLQFETVFTHVSAASGVPWVFADRVFQDRGTSPLTELTADSAQRELDGFHGAAVKGATLFSLKADGTVWKSSDGETFTQASTETFTLLSATTERLLALRRVSFGEATVHESRDDGATWTVIGPVDAGFKVGNRETLFFSRPAGALIRVTVGVSDDSAGNTNFANQTYLLTGSTLELVGALRGTNPIQAPPFPVLQTPAGLAVFSEKDQPNNAPDGLSLVLINNPGKTPDVLTGQRVHWASDVLADSFTEALPLGLDSQGRLMVATAGRVMRTVRPLTTSSDDRGRILKGPGCGGRLTHQPDRGSNPTSKMLVKNESGRPLLVRTIDAQQRWRKQGTVEAGASLPAGADVTYGVMVSDPADDTCLLFQALGESGDIVVR
ncbi:MAG: hypothetical protein JNG84_14220 [Archangium sp.]|nr:hypothetical protein [Archangium sp.]